MTWNHVVSGAAIHLLGRNEMCSCKASHVCQSCQGQDERLRAVNAKLQAALEAISNRANERFSASRDGLAATDANLDGILRLATAAIEANK